MSRNQYRLSCENGTSKYGNANIKSIYVLLDIPNMTGKESRKEASKLDGGEDFLVLLGSKSKKFQSEHAAWLKSIRLCCAACREQDLTKQLEVVFSILPTKIMSEFDALLKELGEVSQLGINLLPSRAVA